MRNHEVRYRSGLVVINEDQATKMLDVANGIKSYCGERMRPIFYGDVCEAEKFLQKYANKKADGLGKKFHFLDCSVDRFEMFDANIEGLESSYFFCVVDVTGLSEERVREFIPSLDDSQDRGFLCGVPKLNWLRVMTSHPKSCGMIVFKNVAMASGRLLSLIRDLIEGVWPFAYYNKFRGEWFLCGCDDCDRDGFKIDPRLKAVMQPFYYEK